VTIPVPGYEDKRIYVWYDAVIGYFAASVEWAKVSGDPEGWRSWWQDPASRTYHFIGKDNIEFHTIIWPGMLIGYDRSLNLPYDVPANEYLNVEGRKLSKSRRWVIEMRDALDRYDPDPWRYALAASAPESQDVNFTWDEFVRRNNEELVSTWGNLANRVLGFAYKRFDGRVPAPGALDDDDRAMLDAIAPAFERITALLDAVKLKQALGEAMGLAREANGYLDRKAPWFQIKEDKAAAAMSVYVILRVVDNLKTILAPVLPHTAQRLHEYLGYEGQLCGTQQVVTYEEETRSHEALTYDHSVAVGTWSKSELPAGQALREPAPLFRKLDESVVEEEYARLAG
jgi:methionyl-tRNA synthetase